MTFVENTNTYVSNFDFQNDQYFGRNVTSFLHIYCSAFTPNTKATDVSANIMISPSSQSTQFNYYNPQAFINQQIQVTLTPNSIFTISISSSPVEVFWTFYSNSTDGFFISAAGSEFVFIPEDSKATLPVLSNTTTKIILKGNAKSSSTVYISTSLSNNLATWKLVLIIVFSVAGGLLVIGAILFLVVYCIRKKPIEYPKTITEVDAFVTESLNNRVKNETEYYRTPDYHPDGIPTST